MRLLFARHRRGDRAEIFQQFPARFSVCLQPCELLIQLDGIGRAPAQAAIHRARVKVHRVQQRLDLNDFLFADRFGGGRRGRRRFLRRIGRPRGQTGFDTAQSFGRLGVALGRGALEPSARLLQVGLAGCKSEFV